MYFGVYEIGLQTSEIWMLKNGKRGILASVPSKSKSQHFEVLFNKLRFLIVRNRCMQR